MTFDLYFHFLGATAMSAAAVAVTAGAIWVIVQIVRDLRSKKDR